MADDKCPVLNLDNLSFQIPKTPEVDITHISLHKKEEIEAALAKAQRSADQKLEESVQLADDTKAEAESKYSLASKKYDSATKVLNIQIKNATEELWLVYQQCQSDSSGAAILPHKRAICVAQFNQGLSEKKVEFQKAMQKLDQTKAAAEAEWQKAQQDYNSAQCLALAEKDSAYQKAEVEKSVSISKALED